MPSGTTIERRVITVLIADLVGFTSLSEQLDAEDIHTIQEAYFASVEDVIGRYRGMVQKYIGDAAVATFGLHRAGDDDPERAVRAGLALVSAVERIGERLGMEPDGLRLRVGVNTGEVVYSEGGPTRGQFTGDSINVAARLQTAAKPGSVLVGQTTALAIADSIETARVGLLRLKGKREPHPAWEALSVRAERSRDLAMGQLHAPTVGRSDELHWLTETLDAALSAGGGRSAFHLSGHVARVGAFRRQGCVERGLSSAGYVDVHVVDALLQAPKPPTAPEVGLPVVQRRGPVTGRTEEVSGIRFRASVKEHVHQVGRLATLREEVERGEPVGVLVVAMRPVFRIGDRERRPCLVQGSPDTAQASDLRSAVGFQLRETSFRLDEYPAGATGVVCAESDGIPIHDAAATVRPPSAKLASHLRVGNEVES